MRATIFLYWLFIGTASAAAITEPYLIVSDKPFMQGDTVEVSEKELPYTDEVDKIEKGILNGVNYSFSYSDGSGTFAGTPGNTEYSLQSDDNWSVLCKKDPISDEKMCRMHMKDLWVVVPRYGKAIVGIGYKHFPSSTVTIRIDGGTPFTTYSTNNGTFPPNTSAKIIERLKHAKSLTTRYKEWPDNSWVDDSWELYGFNEAFKYINWAVRRIK